MSKMLRKKLIPGRINGCEQLAAVLALHPDGVRTKQPANQPANQRSATRLIHSVRHSAGLHSRRDRSPGRPENARGENQAALMM